MTCANCMAEVEDDDVDFLEAWAELNGGRLRLGEVEVEMDLAWCSPGCLVRWVERAYYVAG